MIEVLQAPFIRAARAHGIGEYRMLLRYAMPVAANPLISLFGFSVATMLSASLLVEVILSWPGIGPLLLEAILAKDVYVVLGDGDAFVGFFGAGKSGRGLAAAGG